MTRLIDADALYRRIKTECNPYGRPTIDFESGKKVLDIIDNAPTVEYTFEEAFQKTVCEQRLYCPERPQDEWSLVEHKKNIDLVCPRCGYHRCNLAYGFSIEEVREQIKEDKSNDYLLPDFCERCGAKLGFGGNKE